MRVNFRQGLIVTTAIVGLSTMTAVAAPGGANDSTAPGTAATSPTATSPTGPATSSQADQTGPASQQSMEARVEQRISDLHAKLQITPAQEADWKKFAQTMRDNARKMDQAFEARIQQMQTMSALDNMQSYAHISEQHAHDVQALLPPFKALYASMSESQKHTADQVFREDANRGQPAQPRNG